MELVVRSDESVRSPNSIESFIWQLAVFMDSAQIQPLSLSDIVLFHSSQVLHTKKIKSDRSSKFVCLEITRKKSCSHFIFACVFSNHSFLCSADIVYWNWISDNANNFNQCNLLTWIQDSSECCVINEFFFLPSFFRISLFRFHLFHTSSLTLLSLFRQWSFFSVIVLRFSSKNWVIASFISSCVSVRTDAGAPVCVFRFTCLQKFNNNMFRLYFVVVAEKMFKSCSSTGAKYRQQRLATRLQDESLRVFHKVSVIQRS